MTSEKTNDLFSYKYKETFIEDVTVYGSKLPVISDEWMEECFHRLEAEYQVEQHKEV